MCLYHVRAPEGKDTYVTGGTCRFPFLRSRTLQNQDQRYPIFFMCSLKVAVVGATGMTGSHATVELLRRGHFVVGVCRNPSKMGQHERYEPRSIDLSNSDVMDIAAKLQGIDVVVNAYGPHSQLGSAFAYSK